MKRIHGLGPESPVPGVTEMSLLYTADSWERLCGAQAKIIESGECYELELDIMLSDGAVTRTLARGEAECDVTGAVIGLHGTVQDITMLRNAEQMMLHESVMHSLSILAVGIAHEVNQPLAALSLAIENCERKTGDTVYLFEKYRRMKGYVERISHIIKSIRRYADAHKKCSSEAFSINEAVAHIIGTVKPQLRALGITVRVILNEAIPDAAGDRNKYEQVLTELVSNARYAIEKKLCDAPEYNGEIVLSTSAEAGVTVLRVCDNGIGIPDEIKNRLFTPFFTTKPAGEGVGLGLALSYSFISSMGGEISVESAPGIFTGFAVRMPLYEPEHAGRK